MDDILVNFLGPMSITVNVAELRMSSSIGGTTSDVLLFPSLSATFTVSYGEIDGQGVSAVFISSYVELQKLQIYFTDDLICLMSFIVENILTNSSKKPPKRNHSIPLSPESNKSFLSDIPAVSYPQRKPVIYFN